MLTLAVGARNSHSSSGFIDQTPSAGIEMKFLWNQPEKTRLKLLLPAARYIIAKTSCLQAKLILRIRNRKKTSDLLTAKLFRLLKNGSLAPERALNSQSA
jgi:hypothetical protein